ncbi:hypothetical protein K443DRAFT_258728 [Laccaria amethystina LaAM-08-1]|uniref:Uncharacterized protein n=1 Tax=Laccaria amethystina LaAM-08-1 TaxID=1095629 RepID=A0A0C9XHG8_9AGAR|nr:hypothetical protein K443DRAFT_258728 [Laccaria amethystina LaAM-08-1]
MSICSWPSPIHQISKDSVTPKSFVNMPTTSHRTINNTLWAPSTCGAQGVFTTRLEPEPQIFLKTVRNFLSLGFYRLTRQLQGTPLLIPRHIYHTRAREATIRFSPRGVGSSHPSPA